MAIELKIPSSGESITEVVIGEWLKAVGDQLALDEAVALIETDKANVEVLAPVAGTLSKIVKKAGETAGVGEVIGYLEASGTAPAPSPSEAPKAAPAPKPAPVPKADPPPEAKPSAEAPAEPAAPASKMRIAPSVRRAMREEGVDPSALASEPGRITMGDLKRHQASPAPLTEAPAEGHRREERVAMTPLRKRIASRLVQAQQEAALLTTFNEVDMSAVMRLRSAYKERFLEQHGVKLGFMSFFVKAAVEALKAYPAINAEIRDQEIIYRDYFDIGVAVGGGRGLVVPVLRNVERLSFADVERQIGELAGRAKANRLKVEDLEGGTFTISNGGVYGSLLSTPIVNPPQSGILGMHAIQDRPVVKDGQIVIGKMMYLALTYDHRIVDGREAVRFLVRIKECVEHPERLLLEV